MSFFPSRAGLVSSLLCACSLACPSAPASAAGLCLKVGAGEREALSLPVVPGSELRLSFINSVYGSAVEEILRLTGEGLQSSLVLYAEARLAEFYGYETASYENGFWVVAPISRRFNPLHLRVSGDCAIEISVDGRAVPLPEAALTGASVRLSVASCEANRG